MDANVTCSTANPVLPSKLIFFITGSEQGCRVEGRGVEGSGGEGVVGGGGGGWCGVEWSGSKWRGRVKWNGVAHNASGWCGVSCSGVECSAVRWSAWGVMEGSEVQCGGVEGSGIEECVGVVWNAVQCGAVPCSGVERTGEVVCSAVQRNTVQCSTVQGRAGQCRAVQYSAVQSLRRNPAVRLPQSNGQYDERRKTQTTIRIMRLPYSQRSTVQCSAVQCSAVQCSAVQCSGRALPLGMWGQRALNRISSTIFIIMGFSLKTFDRDTMTLWVCAVIRSISSASSLSKGSWCHVE